MVDNPYTGGWISLLTAIREYMRGRIAISFVIIAMASILEGVGLFLLLPIANLIFTGSINIHIDKLLQSAGITETLHQLILFCALFMVLMLVRATILLKRDAMLSELSFGFVDQLRTRLFTAIAAADWPTIKQMQRSHLLDNLTTNIARVSGAMRFLTQALITVTMVAVYIISGFVVNFMVGLVLLVIAAIVAFAAVIWSKRSKAMGTDMTRKNRGVMDETTRFLDGLKTAKACQATDVFVGRFAASIKGARAVSVEFVKEQGRRRRTVEILGAAAAVGLLLLGYAVLRLDPDELLIMGAVVIRLMPGLIALLQGVQTISYALPAFASAEGIRLELEKISTGNSVGAQHDNKNAEFKSFTAPVIFKDVNLSVGTDGGKVTLLQIEKLEIPATGLVHIGGASGAGKSSFAELLAGLNMPSSGTLQTGDLVLSHASRAAWQSRIAMAPQEPFLFAGSVRENLCWPNLQTDDAHIWNILKMAAADELVRGLPGGLDSDLQDGGSRLSGGERQRLCLARVLLRPSSILIIDEATSAVDARLEEHILKNIHNLAKDKLVVCVSHSGYAKSVADSHISIDNGMISAN